MIPSELLLMILHGEQNFHFHAPILPDTTVSTRAAAVGLQPRSSGVPVVVKAETRDEHDQLLVEQYMTSFVRGAQTPEAIGQSAPPHAFDQSLRGEAPAATVSQRSTRIRRSATRRHPAIRCRSTSTTRSPSRCASPGSSSTGVHDGVHVGRRDPARLAE